MNDDRPDGREHEEDEVGAGVFVGGSMTGGAIVTGKDGRAEDRGRRTGSPSEQELVPPTAFPASLPPDVVAVSGHVTGGALVTGAGGSAVDSSTRLDSGSEEGLAQIRRELSGLRNTFEVRSVMAEVDLVEREIHDRGEAGRGLIERLLGLFNGGSTVLRDVSRGAEFAERLRDSLMLLDTNREEI